MCDPMTLAVTSFAVSAASSVAGFIGQGKAAKANEQAANVTAANNYNDLQQRNVQIDANQSENTVNAMIQRAQNQGRISSSASAFGLDATTAQGLQQSSDFEVGRNLSIDQLNSQEQRQQSDATGRGIAIQRVSDINRVQKPSALGLVLGLGKDAVQSASGYHDLGGKF